jgi:N,N'-diacetylchitobiose transport system permease protein
MADIVPTSGRRRRRPARESDTVTVGRSRAGTVAANLAGIGFVILMSFPVYWVVNTAFKPSNEILQFDPTLFPHNPTLDNFKSAFNAPYFQESLVNGILITVGAVIGAIVVGFLGALAIARFRFHGRKAIILVVLGV